MQQWFFGIYHVLIGVRSDRGREDVRRATIGTGA